jgi:hypothetical protein
VKQRRRQPLVAIARALLAEVVGAAEVAQEVGGHAVVQHDVELAGRLRLVLPEELDRRDDEATNELVSVGVARAGRSHGGDSRADREDDGKRAEGRDEQRSVSRSLHRRQDGGEQRRGRSHEHRHREVHVTAGTGLLDVRSPDSDRREHRDRPQRQRELQILLRACLSIVPVPSRPHQPRGENQVRRVTSHRSAGPELGRGP